MGVEGRDIEGNGMLFRPREGVEGSGATDADREMLECRTGSDGVGSMIVHPNSAVNIAVSDGSGRESTSMESVCDEVDAESSWGTSLCNLIE